MHKKKHKYIWNHQLLHTLQGKNVNQREKHQM